MFEGLLLVVKFTDYAGDADGGSAACATVVGVYEVHLLEGGSIRFMKLQDDCAFRSDTLSGQPDLGFDLVYHRVG